LAGDAGEADRAGSGNRLDGIGQRYQTIYLASGPEGGISGAELAALTAAGAKTARLGPEVLRAGLAGPAALAVINHLLGRWAN
jgi:16S rRNA (uracil1498-N3)-methyltransferase